MSTRRKFTGKVVRIEPDGFGVVRFDEPLDSNTHGFFSSATSSALPYRDLKLGVHVGGLAEVDDDRDLAAVRELKAIP